MKTILVGVDGSPSSRAAVDYAASLARQSGGGLLLAYVAEPPATLAAELPGAADEVRVWAQRVLEDIARRASRTGLGVETAVLTGNPADTLADTARAACIELVVVGHRRRGAFARVVLGSVSDRLAQISPKPLLVV